MKVAVKLLYAGGNKQAWPAAEVLGTLTLGRDPRTRAVTARLHQVFGKHWELALPPLQDARQIFWVDDVFRYVGFEQASREGPWCMQVWSCRQITYLEMLLAQKRAGAEEPSYVLHRHWWATLIADALDTHVIPIARVRELLEIELSQCMEFIDWACRSGRCYVSTHGDAELGTLTIKCAGEPPVYDEAARFRAI